MIELKSYKSSSWYFHNQFPRMPYNLACRIDELTTEGIGVDTYRNDWSTDIFLERLKQVMAHTHHIIPGSVSSETLEW